VQTSQQILLLILKEEGTAFPNKILMRGKECPFLCERKSSMAVFKRLKIHQKTVTKLGFTFVTRQTSGINLIVDHHKVSSPKLVGSSGSEPHLLHPHHNHCYRFMWQLKMTGYTAAQFPAKNALLYRDKTS